MTPDLTHDRPDCDPGRTETYDVTHQGGVARVVRCLDCGSHESEWTTPPLPQLPEGFEPLHVPTPYRYGVSQWMG